jgi:hypothetical protein
MADIPKFIILLLAIYTVVGAHAGVPTIAGVPSVLDVF